MGTEFFGVKQETGEGGTEISKIPEEIQLHLLSYLGGNIKDLKHCCKAYGWWNELLQPQKPTFLAPEVLPHLVGYLDMKDMINCRGVCKVWKKTVDYTLTYGSLHVRDEPNVCHTYLENISPERPIFSRAFIQFNTSEEIDRFTALVASCQMPVANPFLWRSVSFNFTPTLNRIQHGSRRTQEEYQQFYDKALALLTRYGHHIWRFRYQLPDISQLRWPQLTARSQFMAILRTLRNAKSLELLETRPRGPVTEERVERMPHFPRMRNLRELHFPQYAVTFTRFMQQMVVFYGPQINTFNMHGCLFHKYCYWLPQREERLRVSELCPNLVHLTVRGYTSPALWQLTKCPHWGNLRKFQLLVTRDNCCENHRKTAESWWLLKVVYQLVVTARNLAELVVDLQEPDALPLIYFRDNILIVNGTFDDDDDHDDADERSGDNGVLKLRVPTAIITTLTSTRHLIIRAYKKTPIGGFREFDQLASKLMPLDWFWDSMHELRSITIEINLFDDEKKMVLLSDRIKYERVKSPSKISSQRNFESLVSHMRNMKI